MNGQANHSETASLATCGKQKMNHLTNLSKLESKKEELVENDKDKSASSNPGILSLFMITSLSLLKFFETNYSKLLFIRIFSQPILQLIIPTLKIKYECAFGRKMSVFTNVLQLSMLMK